MKWKNAVLITAGAALALLGAVGMLVPVWPTTPFVLLAIGCFSGAPRLRKRLLSIRYFREYHDSYTSGAGLPRQTVRHSMVFLWGMLLLSCLLMRKPWVILLMAGIGAAVTLHILCVAKPRPKASPKTPA